MASQLLDVFNYSFESEEHIEDSSKDENNVIEDSSKTETKYEIFKTEESGSQIDIRTESKDPKGEISDEKGMPYSFGLTCRSCIL